MAKTPEFIFPTFVFEGDGKATSNQISAYCSEWFYNATGASTFINVVYAADVMPIYAVPNVRIYEVTRSGEGFELHEVIDFVDFFVGERVPDSVPFDAIIDEAYWWDFIDWCSLRTPSYFPTISADLPPAEVEKSPILTPDGFVNTPFSGICPADIFNPGGKFPGHPQITFPPNNGGEWFFAGVSRYSYAYSYDVEPIDELFPNLEESTDFGSYSGLGQVVGGTAFGKFQTAQMMFGGHPFDGGVSDIYLLENLYPLPPYDPISYYINHGAYWPQYEGGLGNNTGGHYQPADRTLSSLSGSIISTSVSDVRILATYKDCRVFTQISAIHGNIEEMVMQPSPQTKYIYELYTYHFYSPVKSLKDILPFLPSYIPPVEPVAPVGIFPPLFLGGLLGGLTTQTTQSIANLLLASQGAGRRDRQRGRH